MSDHFTDQNNAKLSSSVDNLECFQEDLADVSLDDLNSSYDHMYATNHDENGLTEDAQSICQTAESEVNFLKEFLLIHLDLIQQQSEDILNKENTIFLLQEENTKLREQLRSLESDLPLQSCSNFAGNKLSESSPNSLSEDMTLDSGPVENNNAENLVQTAEAEPHQSLSISPLEATEPKHQEANTNFFKEEVANEPLPPVQNVDTNTDVDEKPAIVESSKESERHPVLSITELETPPLVSELNYSNSSYTIHSNSLNSADPMRNLKMSIRRKRVCSNSSVLSNNDSMSDEKRNFRKCRKKRKRIVKNDQIHTYDKQYVTQVGDQLMDVLRRQELADEVARQVTSSSLEVPRWRLKVYTSCYAMEGTENLEDDVFLRRHTRLENDERRRKRWDVQRIREQRIVDKLKQRQDKKDLREKGVDQAETVESLWPSIEDVKYVEVCDVLPVSAFGCPLPKIQPSEFSIPWLTNPNLKKTTTRRSTARRRGNRR